uniref:RING-type domain-containing protein n=1 Tax=Palpitomonas bilix TaxID=652834 RepID=A0A7S3GE50_9EUKA|mmetsp:Transcript_45567/g.117782  ORF Transcript_45567/g.117782 Transcript_45567/m.117782 type:complete len:242 (+) Transcript_45567:198-923(+)
MTAVVSEKGSEDESVGKKEQKKSRKKKEKKKKKEQESEDEQLARRLQLMEAEDVSMLAPQASGAGGRAEEGEVDELRTCQLEEDAIFAIQLHQEMNRRGVENHDDAERERLRREREREEEERKRKEKQEEEDLMMALRIAEMGSEEEDNGHEEERGELNSVRLSHLPEVGSEREVHQEVSQAAPVSGAAEDDASTCRICFERQKDFALVPCGHRLCGLCSNAVEECPFCRQEVREVLRLFD